MPKDETIRAIPISPPPPPPPPPTEIDVLVSAVSATSTAPGNPTTITVANAATTNVYFSTRISGLLYQDYYGAPNAHDAPWAYADPSPNNWDRYETHAGKRVTAIQWGGGMSLGSFDKTANLYCRNRGAYSAYDQGFNRQQIIDLANNSDANGTLTALANWAKSVATQNFPILYRPMWEMNGNWGGAWNWQTGAGTTQTQYIAAWRNMHTILVANCSCLSFFWCPNVWTSSGAPDPTPWFPGVAYVDWVGFDGYNQGGAISPINLFNQTLATVKSLAPGLPVGIGETGCWTPASYAGGKAQWFTDLFAWLKNHPEVKHFNYFNDADVLTRYNHIEVGNAASDGTTNPPAAALAAFAAGIADPRYLANIVSPTTFPSGRKVPVP